MTVSDNQYETHTAEEINQFVGKHAELVKRIAHQLFGRMPPSVQLEDLIQSGMVGLLEAARTYQLDGGASFETFAGIRIRGAMLDFLRKGDWVPRSVYRKARAVNEAIEKLENKHSRAVRDDEVAEALNLPIRDYQKLLANIANSRLKSLGDLGLAENQVKALQTASEYSSEPMAGVSREQFIVQLSAALECLPEQEQLVMQLYYQEELNLKEIGEVLTVSESRICQIHSVAIEHLQQHMIQWR